MIKNIIYFKVAGVSYHNDDGSYRQDIITKLHDDDILHFLPYTYECSPAYHIVTEAGKCIGNVPVDYIHEVTDAINDPDNDYMLAVSDISPRDDDGRPIEGYYQGVTVALYIHDDARQPHLEEPVNIPVAPDSSAAAPKKKNASSTIMIVFGVIFVFGFLANPNPLSFICAFILLVSGIRKRKGTR